MMSVLHFCSCIMLSLALANMTFSIPGHTIWACWVQIAFAISFFICRLLVGPAVIYYTLICPTSPMIVKVTMPFVWCLLWQEFPAWLWFCWHAQVGGVGIQIVSLFWFYKIAQVRSFPRTYVCLLCPTHMPLICILPDLCVWDKQ